MAAIQTPSRTQVAAENEIASATQAHAIRQIPNGGHLFESPIVEVRLVAEIERLGYRFQHHVATGSVYKRGNIGVVAQNSKFWTWED